MASTPRRYRKLAGPTAGLANYTTLYVGLDHLLQVSSTGYSESYKRFYFRDIQAFSVNRTGTATASNAILGGLALIFLTGTVFLVLPGGDTAGAIAFGIFTGGFVLSFLINLLRGPSCRCHVRTPVQVERLPSLGRVRKALKVLRQLQPLIESAQASLGPPMSTDNSTIASVQSQEAPPADQSSVPPGASSEGRPEAGA